MEDWEIELAEAMEKQEKHTLKQGNKNMEVKNNKYIQRKVFMTNDEVLADAILGYVNKKYGTTTLNLGEKFSITVENKDIKYENDTLYIQIKQNNVLEDGKVSVYVKKTGKRQMIPATSINAKLTQLGMKESKDDSMFRKPLTLKEKLALINE